VYSAELLDHFQNPRNAGEVECPDRTRASKTRSAETFWNSLFDWKAETGREADRRHSFSRQGLRSSHGLRIGDHGVDQR
jgi:hypothetical protein